jgi:glycosyltransferase involved in cell wall biosynthesis
MDAQGVSKDEAMASGLVVVTNSVTAIPEFCDEKCAIMADSEDYIGMAEGIKNLFLDSELFTSLSKNSHQRVLSQTASTLIITKEIELIQN